MPALSEHRLEEVEDACTEAKAHLERGLALVYQAAGMASEDEAQLKRFRSLALQLEAIMDLCEPVGDD